MEIAENESLRTDNQKIENLNDCEKAGNRVEGGSLDSRHFHYVLMQTFKRVDRLIHERTSKLGLDPGQPKILQCLYEGRGKTPKEIGQWCVLDKSTITILLKLMEQKGLLEKRPSQVDKRSCEIALTAHGQQLAQKVMAIGKEVDQIVLSNLDQVQKETLMALLDAVNENAARSQEEKTRLQKQEPEARTKPGKSQSK